MMIKLTDFKHNDAVFVNPANIAYVVPGTTLGSSIVKASIIHFRGLKEPLTVKELPDKVAALINKAKPSR